MIWGQNDMGQNDTGQNDMGHGYCICTYFSGIHILAELALNQVR